jgi:hypothetical protein
MQRVAATTLVLLTRLWAEGLLSQYGIVPREAGRSVEYGGESRVCSSELVAASVRKHAVRCLSRFVATLARSRCLPFCGEQRHRRSPSVNQKRYENLTRLHNLVFFLLRHALVL